MANPTIAFGMVPVRHYFGGLIRPNKYTIADQYGTALFEGDPVRATGTGQNIGIGTAGGSAANTGVFMGCEYVDSTGQSVFDTYWPASLATKNAVGAIAYVLDDPFIVWAIRGDATGIVAATDRKMVDLVSGAGDIPTKRSGWSAGPSGGKNQLKVIEVPTSWVHPGGVFNAFGPNSVIHVLWGKHELVATAPTEI